MQKLAEICIRRPVFAAMIILALVVVGTTSYFRLGVDRFPSVDMPTVSVRTSWPGARAEDMESQVTQRIEEVVNTVEGIDELRSVSGPGMSTVMATFKLERNIDVAAQDVRDRVATVVKNLPDDADPPVISKLDNDAMPVMTVALSARRSLRELTEMADQIVKEQLERSTGVGAVWIIGGAKRTSTSGCAPIAWPLTRSPSPMSVMPWSAKTRRFPAGTSPPARASRRCAPWAASTIRSPSTT